MIKNKNFKIKIDAEFESVKSIFFSVIIATFVVFNVSIIVNFIFSFFSKSEKSFEKKYTNESKNDDVVFTKNSIIVTKIDI